MGRKNPRIERAIDEYLKVFNWKQVWERLAADKFSVSERCRLMRSRRFLERVVGEARRRWLEALGSKHPGRARDWHTIYNELRNDLLGEKGVRPDYPDGPETVQPDEPAGGDEW